MSVKNYFVSLNASIELDIEEFGFASVEEMDDAYLEDSLPYSKYKQLLDIILAHGTMAIQKDESASEL